VIRCCVIACLACTLYAGNVLGHATLIASEPADGSTLARQPAAIILRFDEAITPIAVRLLDDTGATVPLDNGAVVNGETMRITLPLALKVGTYWMSYRITSSDSHPVAGAMTFSIGPRAYVSAPQTLATSSAVDVWPRATARAVQDLAVLVCAGGALFALLIAPWPRERVVLVVSAVIAIVGAAAGVWSQGEALLGSGEGLVRIDAWRAGLASTRGTSAGIVVAGTLAIAAGALLASGSIRKVLYGTGIAVFVASACVTGHPATMQPRALALTAIGTHVLAAGFWAGSIVALVMLVGDAPTQRSVIALQRFSRYAVVVVAALAVAAIPLAVIQLGWPPALFDGAYGSLVIAKSVLFATLLAFASWNRFRLVPDLARGHPLAATRLTASIRVEMALIALAIVAAAALSQTSPPHSASIARREIVVVLTAPALAARISVAPGRAGFNTFAVVLTSPGGATVDPLDVVLQFANPRAGAEALVRHPVRVAPGEYRWSGGELAFPGEWLVAVRARVSEFDLAELDGSVTIE
jgi:copper transport protein